MSAFKEELKSLGKTASLNAAKPRNDDQKNTAKVTQMV